MAIDQLSSSLQYKTQLTRQPLRSGASGLCVFCSWIGCVWPSTMQGIDQSALRHDKNWSINLPCLHVQPSDVSICAIDARMPPRLDEVDCGLKTEYVDRGHISRMPCILPGLVFRFSSARLWQDFRCLRCSHSKEQHMTAQEREHPCHSLTANWQFQTF